jgi:hypothetical protein
MHYFFWHLYSSLCVIHLLTARACKDYNINSWIVSFKATLFISVILCAEMRLQLIQNRINRNIILMQLLILNVIRVIKPRKDNNYIIKSIVDIITINFVHFGDFTS